MRLRLRLGCARYHKADATKDRDTRVLRRAAPTAQQINRSLSGALSVSCLLHSGEALYSCRRAFNLKVPAGNSVAIVGPSGCV